MRRLILVGSLTTLLATVSSPSLAQVSFVPDTTRAVYVTGRGTVVTAPDTASVELGVYILGPDLAKSKASADEVIRRLVALASSLSVAEADLRSASVYITPRYADDEPLKFLGYEVTRSLAVTLRDLAKLEALLDGAIKAGSNRDFDVRLDTSREAELKREALAKAIEDAKSQAAFVAAKLGTTLGAIRSVNLNESSRASYSSAFVAKGGTFLPGQVSVDAEAAVTFYIKDEKP